MFKDIIRKLFSRLPISQKFTSDVLWNVASFGIMGVSGIALTLIIARLYGAATLGVFNLAYSIYILLSQVVAGGIHLSVVKYISQCSEDQEENQVIINAAIAATFILSSLAVCIAFFSRGIFGLVLKSKNIDAALIYIFPGLFFFALNKVLLAYHNGCLRMKAYAFFQALRYIFLLACLLVFVSISIEGNKLPAIFSISEALLFVLLSLYSLGFIRLRLSKSLLSWMREHIIFGFRAAIGNILADINTRIDVLILGIFMSDRNVGIYSFAVMFVDGFNQLSVVLRTNVNPLLTGYKYKKSDEELRKFMIRGIKMTYMLMIPLGICAVICFPLIIHLFKYNPEFYKGCAAFTILMIGSFIGVGYAPFQMVLNQTGHPSQQSLFFFLIFITNVVLNFIFVPIFGIYGSAAATAISFASQVFYLKILVRKTLAINV